ncbi:MAG: phosphoribosylformylglycinamidine synthase subunit PurQ [Promethearchaeota archaeon]
MANGIVNVCIITGFGINSDYESAYAFKMAGADNVRRVHVNLLLKGKDELQNYEIIMFPGGFSYGDDLGSGRVLANKFRYQLRAKLTEYIESGRLVFGVCNGFQILVKMGLLPALEKKYYQQTVSLVGNKSGQFEMRWVKLRLHLDSRCVWTKNIEGILELPVRHGEGQFVAKNNNILEKIWNKKLVAMTYEPNSYPNNPNGSVDGIAAICDESGRVFGMMPHPECHIHPYQHPLWTRNIKPKINGLKIFQNAVEFARKNI